MACPVHALPEPEGVLVPRNFGSFTTSIYRDEDFRALTLAQQGAYFLLGLQPDVSAAGVLTLALGRWASKAHGLTRNELMDELKALQDLGHIAIDEETEELLIVKFAKWDRGWANRLRRPVLVTALKAIESAHIRDIAVDELRRVALSDAASEEEEAAKEALSQALSTFDRVVVTEGDKGLEPQTANHEGEPPPLDADASEPPSMHCSKHPEGTEEPCGPCGTARQRFNAWHARDAERQAAAVAEARSLRLACQWCGGSNWREDPATGELTLKCNHKPLDDSPAVAS